MGERHVWPDDPAAGEGEAGTFGGELSVKMGKAEYDDLTHLGWSSLVSTQ